MKLEGMMVEASTKTFIVRHDGALVMGCRLCIPKYEELKREIFNEAYSSVYAMHLGGTKRYHTI